MTQSSTSARLRFDELETLYDELASALDTVPAERESVFLARLVLSMANEFGDAKRISALIKHCVQEPAESDGNNSNDGDNAKPAGSLWGSSDL